MNYPQICRLLAAITGVLALGFILSMGVGFFYGHVHQESVAYMGWMVALFTAAGLLAIFYAISQKPTPALVRKEALCAVGLGWLVAIFITAIPYRVILPDCSWTNAIFEAASGLTTTGSSIFGDVEALPKSLLFWRSMTQWIGGIGVIVIFVAVLSSLGVSAKVLYSSESSAKPVDMDSARVHHAAIQVVKLYLWFTAASIYALWLAGMTPFDAVCHAFTAISTAGFTTHNSDLTAISSPAIQWVLVAIMILGATNFFYMLYAVRGRWQEVRKNEEFQAYIFILLVVSVIVAWILLETQSWKFRDCLRCAVFQVTSFLTTTGFYSNDFSRWTGGAQIFLVLLMFIGGCSGSTAGGFKIMRLVISAKAICLQVYQTIFRRHVHPVTLNGHSMDTGTIYSAFMYMGLIAGTLLIGCALTAVFEPTMSLEGIFSANLSSVGNIGLSFNELGPSQNWDFLTRKTKFLHVVIMLLGRLEFYALLALFVPKVWRRLG